MTADQSPMNRRDALKAVAGLGAGLAWGGRPLWADAGALLRRGLPPAKLLTKPIPSSGEQIPVVGIGTATRAWMSAGNLTPLREVLGELLRRGGTVVDTAPSYGAAETALGTLMAEAGARGQVFLATKVGRGDEGRQAGLDEIEQSKRRLRTDRFDLLQVHNLAGARTMLPVFRELKQAKQIRYYGVTTTYPGQYEELETLLRREPMDFLQIDYAIDNRDVERRILPLAKDRGVGVLTALPFGRGRVFEALGDEPVPRWAAELGIATWAQFALKYIVSHPAVVCAIPGTSRLRHLADNLGAAQGRLPDEPTRRRMAALVDAA